jgi:hypothetical protein
MESSFDIYEDPRGGMIQQSTRQHDGMFGRDMTNVERTSSERMFAKKNGPTEYRISSPPRLASRPPPPFVPTLKLPNQSSTTMSSTAMGEPRMGRQTFSPAGGHSSEDAIKRAVAAAIEKRKQLASMTSSGIGSRSSMSSFVSDIVKPRFGCFLG